MNPELLDPLLIDDINIPSLGEHVAATLMCMPRLIAISVFIPFMKTQFLPGPIRMALLFSIAIYVSPQFVSSHQIPENQEMWFLLAAKEAGVGVMMGLVAGLAFLIPQIIGDFIDNQRGASMAQIFNPAAGGQASIVGTAMSLMVTTIFLTAGGFVLLLDLIFDSYQVLGVHEFVPSTKVEVMLEAIVSIFANAILIGLMLATPVVLVMMLAEFGLGLMGRFVQQLQVFFLAMPIKSLLGFSMLFVYIIVILRIYEANELPLGYLRGLINTFSKL